MSDLDLKVTLRAIDKFSEPARKIAGITEKMTRHLHDGERAIMKIGNQKKAAKGLKNLNEALSKTDTELQDASQAVTQLTQEVKASAKPNSRLVKQFEAKERTIARLNKGLTKTDLELNRAREAAAKLGREIKASDKPNKTLIRQYEAKVKAIGRLEKKHRQQKGSLQQARIASAALRKEVAASIKPNKILIKQLAAQEKKVAHLTQKQTEQRASQRKLNQELKAASIDSKNLASAQDKLGDKYAKATQKMERMAKIAAKTQAAQAKFDKAMQRAANAALIAGGMQRVGQSMLGALSTPLQEAISFESAMADVKKVVNFAEPNGLKKLSNRLLDMTRIIPITKEGLAAIAAEGGQLGVAEKDLPSFVETVAKMSTAFDMLPQEAGEAMAKLSNVYQIPISEMTKLGDAIKHLSDNTAAKAKDIVPVLQRVGGTAKQFGLSAIQAAALGDAFIALGKRPEVAATAINSMLTRLQTATKQGKKFQQALGQMGMSADEMEQSIAMNGQGALSAFLENLSAVDKQTRAGLLTDLFGMEYADDISLLAGSMDEYRKALKLVGSEAIFAGSMEREFQSRSATTGNRIQLMQQRWAALQQRIGNKLIPVLEKLMNVVEPIIDAIGRWVDRHPSLTTGMLGFTGLIGGLALVLAPVVTAIYAFGAAMSWVRLQTNKATMGMAMNRAAGGGFFGGGGKGGGKGMWNRVKGVGGSLGGKAGLAGAAIMGTLSIGTTLADSAMSTGEKAAAITQDVGSIGGALAGAMAGAALGSVVPVVGTAIGGLIGGIMGSMGGDWLGGKLGKLIAVDGKDTQKTTADRNITATTPAKVATAALASPVVAATTLASPQAITNTYETKINVHPSPGMDEQALSNLVVRKIDDANRQAAAQTRSQLYDEI